MKITLKTRQDYMNGHCTHREYYAQFVTPVTKSMVNNVINLSEVTNEKEFKALCKKLGLKVWDSLAGLLMINPSSKIRELGDIPSICGMVCTLKESALQLVEDQNQGE